MRYVLTGRQPKTGAILLVESGSRKVLEELIGALRRIWGDNIPIDVVSCYTSLPRGFEAATTRLYNVGEYRGRQGRARLYRELAKNHYGLIGIVCSGEPLMTKWKWALALRLPAKAFIVNENSDFFWFDRHNLTAMRQFVLFRAGLAGAGAVRTLAGWISFPFTLLYLVLYATTVHLRRALRGSRAGQSEALPDEL